MLSQETRLMHGFKRLWSSTALDGTAVILGKGVKTFDDYDNFVKSLKQVSKQNPGCLGAYHSKLVLDQVVEAGWVTRNFVSWWPVAKHSGTYRGLQLLFPNREPEMVEDRGQSVLRIVQVIFVAQGIQTLAWKTSGK